MKKFRVGILGATGMVGQRYVDLLKNHSWFEIVLVAASERSAGKTYKSAVDSKWKMEDPIPEKVGNLVVENVCNIDKIAKNVDFVFSAIGLNKEETKLLEEQYAKADIPVISNNSAHRWTPDVPMVIPEINLSHFQIIETQKKRLGTSKGFIAVKPNCSIQSYTPILAAWKKFKPTEVNVCTYQSVSGAGKTLEDWKEMQGNVIPFIEGEEEKSEREPLRILGEYIDNEIKPRADMQLSCQCIRVPVLYGHTAAVSIKFDETVSEQELIESLNDYEVDPMVLDLPSSPKKFITYFEENDRPQVLRDVNIEKGMGISVGRLREDSIFDYKFVALSHNTIRGAAGGAILSAEALAKMGYLG